MLQYLSCKIWRKSCYYEKEGTTALVFWFFWLKLMGQINHHWLKGDEFPCSGPRCLCESFSFRDKTTSYSK